MPVLLKYTIVCWFFSITKGNIMSASFVVSIVQLLMLIATFILCITAILIVAGIFDLLLCKEEMRKKEISTQLTWSIISFIATLLIMYVLFDTEIILRTELLNSLPALPPYGPYR